MKAWCLLPTFAAALHARRPSQPVYSTIYFLPRRASLSTHPSALMSSIHDKYNLFVSQRQHILQSCYNWIHPPSQSQVYSPYAFRTVALQFPVIFLLRSLYFDLQVIIASTGATKSPCSIRNSHTGFHGYDWALFLSDVAAIIRLSAAHSAADMSRTNLNTNIPLKSVWMSFCYVIWHTDILGSKMLVKWQSIEIEREN